jgi:hypothetical protein
MIFTARLHSPTYTERVNEPSNSTYIVLFKNRQNEPLNVCILLSYFLHFVFIQAIQLLVVQFSVEHKTTYMQHEHVLIKHSDPDAGSHVSADNVDPDLYRTLKVEFSQFFR